MTKRRMFGSAPPLNYRSITNFIIDPIDPPRRLCNTFATLVSRNFRHFPWKWVGDGHFDDFVSKLVGKIVILTLGAIDSASFNSNFGTSVEMDPILTKFDQF